MASSSLRADTGAYGGGQVHQDPDCQARIPGL